MSAVSRACVRQLRASRCSRHISLAVPVVPRRRTFALSVSGPQPILDLTSSSHEPRNDIRETKLSTLLGALTTSEPNPDSVWGSYNDLLNVARPEDIPLELHQRVLRNCTLPTSKTRLLLAAQLAAQKRDNVPHAHETRLQAVIRNIRAAGHVPTAEDYHFVLEQFAAVGHHVGAVRVLKEMSEMGVERRAKSYGLCLQALNRRLSLPCWHEDRPKLVTEVSNICADILNEMWRLGVPFTSVNTDYALAILKETLDMDNLDRLLKSVYGVDLSYPDRPPLEFWDSGRDTQERLQNDLTSEQPGPKQFSVQALNTTLDVLGRLGNISKMVQVFEVLTTPLPTSVPSVPSSSFDDDDDDFGIRNPAVSSYPVPYVTPNTTTFRTLLRWLAKADHVILARHYLLYAYRLEREQDNALRRSLVHRNFTAEAPKVAVDRSMLLSVFSAANRNKSRSLELLRWVHYMIKKVIRTKEVDISWYSQVPRQNKSRLPRHIPLLEDHSASSEAALSGSATRSSPLSVLMGETGGRSANTASQSERSHTISSSSPQSRPFDLVLHLCILKREVQQISRLEKHAANVIGRDTQRVKERLGRRVWADKDIYLRDKKKRVRVDKDTWRNIVHFSENRSGPEEEDDARVVSDAKHARHAKHQPIWTPVSTGLRRDP
ncbi:hypothetical protein K474DRAFT_166303 [Panus rudis PR-1116 ss-1]|nr:hypothetical protein K474DRAFT_166303 [Panus rudis PR-1116 ss-1]